MARRRTTMSFLVPLLLLAVGTPTAVLAQEEEAEVETDQLPSYAAEEWEAAQAAQQAADPVAQARAIPPPPNEISSARQGMRVEEVPASERDRGAVTFDDFYAGLADYGTWVETPEYGYVFIPHRQAEVRDWRPYLYGRWIWTAYGWTWVSEEPFGWATYHYGRWTWLPGFGWAWVPGYTWGPAWVVWRYGTDAIGWAPLYPGYVAWTTSYPIFISHWIFIGPRYFYAYPVHHHHHHWHHAEHHFHHSHWARHWRHGGSRGYVYSGPPRSYVERRAGVPIRTTRLAAAERPSGRPAEMAPGRAPDEIRVYRPERARVRPSELSAVRPPADASRPPVGSGLVDPRIARPGGQRLATEPGGIRTPSAGRVEPPRAGAVEPRRDVAAPRPGQVQRVEPPRAQPQVAPPSSQPGRVAPARPEPERVAPPRAEPRVSPPRVSPPKVAPPKVEPGRAEPPRPRQQLAPSSAPVPRQDRLQAPRTAPTRVTQPRSSLPRSDWPSVRTPSRSTFAPARSATPRIEAPRASSSFRPSRSGTGAGRPAAPRLRGEVRGR